MSDMFETPSEDAFDREGDAQDTNALPPNIRVIARRQTCYLPRTAEALRQLTTPDRPGIVGAPVAVEITAMPAPADTLLGTHYYWLQRGAGATTLRPLGLSQLDEEWQDAAATALGHLLADPHVRGRLRAISDETDEELSEDLRLRKIRALCTADAMVVFRDSPAFVHEAPDLMSPQQVADRDLRISVGDELSNHALIQVLERCGRMLLSARALGRGPNLTAFDISAARF